MRKDTLYITLSRDITSYTITSGQRAIATNVNYAVTIESPTLTTNLAGRDVSVIISDTEGNTLTTATTFYPDTKNPYKAVTGSLLLDGTVYAKFFDGKPVDTAVRLPIVIRDKSATLLSSDIVVMNGGENAEPTASDETVAGLVNAIRFYDLAEFKAWLDGIKTRDDGLRPTDIVVGQWVHTQQDGSFICKELIGAEPSVAKNFTAIVTQFPLTGTLKMNPSNGMGLSLYSGDVYNEAEATSFSIDAVSYKGDDFTFKAGGNQIARQKDNYALENRVNSKMDETLDAIKADNDETYAAMLPVRNETVEARDRAETAARGAKASETRAITAEENAATSEQNAEASKKSAAVSEANAWLYRQQALAYSQKAETEAATATTKATEASDSALSASAYAGSALAHEVKAGEYEASAKQYAEASYHNAESSASSAASALSSADTAAQSETIAVGSASAAASSANTASEHKDAALSSATNAATSATNAATSATNAATSSTSASNFASASSDSAKAAATSAADLANAMATVSDLSQRTDTIEAKNARQCDDYLTGYIPRSIIQTTLTSAENNWQESYAHATTVLPCYEGFVVFTQRNAHYISPTGECSLIGGRIDYNSMTPMGSIVRVKEAIVCFMARVGGVLTYFKAIVTNTESGPSISFYSSASEDIIPSYLAGKQCYYDTAYFGWPCRGLIFMTDGGVLDYETLEQVGSFGPPSPYNINILSGSPNGTSRLGYWDKASLKAKKITVSEDNLWNLTSLNNTSFGTTGCVLEDGSVIPTNVGMGRYYLGITVSHNNGYTYSAQNEAFFIDPSIPLPCNLYAAIDGIYKSTNWGLIGTVKVFNVGTMRVGTRIMRDYLGNFILFRGKTEIYVFRR